jgi:AP-2 complex subunit alpha
VKEPNIRYLALETMAKLSGIKTSGSLLKHHFATILISLKDADISIRRRALDLLFCLCD